MSIVTDFDYNCPNCDNGLEHIENGIWECVSCDYKESTDIIPCANPDCSNLIKLWFDSPICEECREL